MIIFKMLRLLVESFKKKRTLLKSIFLKSIHNKNIKFLCS